MRMAALLVTALTELLAMTVYDPASLALGLAMVYEALVAPLRFTPSFCHCKVGEGEPLAAAVNVTEAPTVTVWLVGWVVKAGA